MFILDTLILSASNVMAADGILDFVGGKADEATGVLRTIALLIAVGFVIITAIASRGQLSKIVISGLAAGALLWVVFNVDTVSDSVDQEVNSAPAPASAFWSPAPASPSS